MENFFDSSQLMIVPGAVGAYFPYLLLSIGVVVLTIAAALSVGERMQRYLSAAFLFATAGIFYCSFGNGSIELLGSSYVVNDSARFSGVIICLLAALSSFFVAAQKTSRGEWAPIMHIAALGFALIPTARDFVSFFVAMETAAISSYILAAFDASRTKSLEAGLKYLILGALSTAFYLMGVALIYGVSGGLSFAEVSKVLEGTFEGSEKHLMFAGAALLVCSLGLKVALVPFHMWAADVYQGAPTALAAFMATATKVALFSGLINILALSGLWSIPSVGAFIKFISILSIVIGSLMAIAQTSFRRMLAYSSVVNAGYAAIALLGGPEKSQAAILVFLSFYGFGALLLFALCEVFSLSLNSRPNGDLELEDFARLSGSQKKIFIFMFVVGVLSLAGIPPFPGFFAKYLLIKVLWSANEYGASGVLVLGSLLGLAYYLRTIVPFFASDEKEANQDKLLRGTFVFIGIVVLSILALGLYNFGVLPGLFDGAGGGLTR